MNKLAFCALIVALCLGAALAQTQVCLPTQFSVFESLWDPSQHTVIESIHRFDWPGQRERWDIQIESPKKVYETFIIDYKQEREWLISNGQCWMRDIHGSLHQHCLLESASYQGLVTVGGSLKVDVWKEEFQAKDGSTAVNMALLTNGTNYPVQGVFWSKDTGVVQINYFDFYPAVDDNAFVPPPYCPHAASTDFQVCNSLICSGATAQACKCGSVHELSTPSCTETCQLSAFCVANKLC